MSKFYRKIFNDEFDNLSDDERHEMWVKYIREKEEKRNISKLINTLSSLYVNDYKYTVEIFTFNTPS